MQYNQIYLMDRFAVLTLQNINHSPLALPHHLTSFQNPYSVHLQQSIIQTVLLHYLKLPILIRNQYLQPINTALIILLMSVTVRPTIMCSLIGIEYF